MRLILVRHAETEDNAKQVVTHPTEGELNPTGKKQAEKLGKRFKNDKIDVIFCSTADRTCATVEQVKRHHPDTKVVYSKAIIEKHPGDHHGKTYAQMREIRQKSGFAVHTYRPKGGESYEDVVNRAKKFYDYLVELYKGKTVFIMTHGAFLKAMIIVIFKIPVQFHSVMSFGNTSVTIIEVADGGDHRAELINCRDHLYE